MTNCTHYDKSVEKAWSKMERNEKFLLVEAVVTSLFQFVCHTLLPTKLDEFGFRDDFCSCHEQAITSVHWTVVIVLRYCHSPLRSQIKKLLATI